MNKFIIFLRGINVSGQKKIRMAELRSLLENSEFDNVKTYIQSGNIVLQIKLNDKAVIKAKVESILENEYQFKVPVLVKTTDEIKQIIEGNPWQDEKLESSYYCLFYESPSEDALKNFGQTQIPNEELFVSHDCVYLFYINGAGRAKINNNFIERKLNTVATTRNNRTMQKLLTLSAE